MAVSFLVLGFMIIVGGVAIGLQILASFKGGKWIGLIIPVLHIFVSLIVVFGIGTLVGAGVESIMVIGALFFLIPMVIYLGIFFVGLTVKNNKE